MNKKRLQELAGIKIDSSEQLNEDFDSEYLASSVKKIHNILESIGSKLQLATLDKDGNIESVDEKAVKKVREALKDFKYHMPYLNRRIKDWKGEY